MICGCKGARQDNGAQIVDRGKGMPPLAQWGRTNSASYWERWWAPPRVANHLTNVLARPFLTSLHHPDFGDSSTNIRHGMDHTIESRL